MPMTPAFAADRLKLRLQKNGFTLTATPMNTNCRSCGWWKLRVAAPVGHQPLIQPGAQFDYSSWTMLDTPIGMMEGEFYCVTEDVQFFEAKIEPFALARSKSLH